MDHYSAKRIILETELSIADRNIEYLLGLLNLLTRLQKDYKTGNLKVKPDERLMAKKLEESQLHLNELKVAKDRISLELKELSD